MSSRSRGVGGKERNKLRCGFSTGTAAVAAARGALRHLLTGERQGVVAVRLPLGYYLPVDIQASKTCDGIAWASVIKDGGDDPDVTHRAEIRAEVLLLEHDPQRSSSSQGGAGSMLCVTGGTGVGVVTKAGLPVNIGEPAINPVPREMLLENLTEEWHLSCPALGFVPFSDGLWRPPQRPHFLLPMTVGETDCQKVVLSLSIEVPDGVRLARKTLNPRLGILGGISILGTTGLVKPFSHEAYEETIQAALSVAAAGGCRDIVLSTGGKSEQFARKVLPDLPEEAFVQIADFYGFAVSEARRLGFKCLIHSVFFGKVLKMGQGHSYTHAHKVSLDLRSLAGLAKEMGHEDAFCAKLASANTARHALEILWERNALDVIEGAARIALERSLLLVERELSVRLLLFNYDGSLLADVGH